MSDTRPSQSFAEQLHHILYQYEQTSHKRRIDALSELQLTRGLVNEKTAAVAAIEAALDRVIADSKLPDQTFNYGGTSPYGVTYHTTEDAVKHGFNQGSAAALTAFRQAVGLSEVTNKEDI